MKCIILSGGLGTRLKGVIENSPKPMAPVESKPFLEYLVLQLHAQGFQNLVFCIGYLGKQIRDYFDDGSRWGVHIHYSREPSLLGTGGAIKWAAGLIKEENFLVMNGDSFFDIDLKELVRYHLEKDAMVTMALTEVENPERYGTVELDESGRIRSFKEKSKNSRSRVINGGIYVLNRRIFDYIPEGKVSLEEEVFPKLIGKGIYGTSFKGFFIDIGVPEEYRKLRENSKALLKLLEGVG